MNGRRWIINAMCCVVVIGVNAIAMDSYTQQSPEAQSISPAVQKAALGQGSFSATPVNATTQVLGWLNDAKYGQSPGKLVLEHMENKRWKQALQALDQKQVDVDKTPYLAFLKGMLALWADQPEVSWPLLSTLAKKKGFLFKNEAYYHAQRAAFEQKQWPQALAMASGVSSSSHFYEASMLLQARTLKQLKKEKKVQSLYQKYLKRYPRSRSSVDVAMSMGELAQSNGQWAMALDAYEHIEMNHPLSSRGREAQKQIKRVLRKLPAKKRAAYAARQSTRQMVHMKALFKRHRSEKLIATYKKRVKPLKGKQKASEAYCEQVGLIARSYSKLRKHEQSTAWYKRWIDSCAEHPSQLVRALYLGGKAYWNADQRAPAKKHYKRLWTLFPKHSYADDAMYFSARILREEKKPKAVQALLQAQVKRYPKGDMAKDAHWLLVRSWFAGKSYKKVIDYVDALSDPGERDLYSQGRLAYFAARAHAKLGQDVKARARFEAIIKAYPMGYYAMLSMQQLGRVSQPKLKASVDICGLNQGALCTFEADASESFEPTALIKQVLETDRDVQRGVIFLRLGLERWASRSFRRARGRYAKKPQTLWAIAWMLDASGAYPLSHDIPRRVFKHWKTAYPNKHNRMKWEVAYPQPFLKTVSSYAKSRQIAPALIYAIMREESGFSPRIESWANARGLMQLMDKTATRIAQVDKMKDYKSSVLFTPKKNIRLGSAYLKELSTQFDAHPILIIAGYNGGYGNVSRWLARNGSAPIDLWVEDIPYGQTRKYTKRVLTSYWAYHWLYGKKKTPTFKLSGYVPK